MEFSIEKYANSEKRETTPDRKNGTTKSRTNTTPGEKETYKYLRILETDTSNK